jgi:hypothetical protein
MVGHNPGLEDLIFDLVPDNGSPLRDEVETKFPTASFAVLELDVERWAQVEDGCARFTHLMRPRDLAAGEALVGFKGREDARGYPSRSHDVFRRAGSGAEMMRLNSPPALPKAPQAATP